MDIFTSATGNFKISGLEQRLHVAPTGFLLEVQSLQGESTCSLMNWPNFAEIVITPKYLHFVPNDLIIASHDIGQFDILNVDKDIGQFDILNVDMFDSCLLRDSSTAVMTLKDEGILHRLRGGTSSRKTKNKRNRIKALRKIACAKTPTSSETSSVNLSLLEPSWINEEGERQGG